MTYIEQCSADSKVDTIRVVLKRISFEAVPGESREAYDQAQSDEAVDACPATLLAKDWTVRAKQ